MPPARTAHAAMVDSRGRMWIVGGETFSYSHHLDMVATFSPDLINKDVQGIWATVHAKGEKGPSPRYGHSAVIHEDKVGKLEGTEWYIFTSKKVLFFCEYIYFLKCFSKFSFNLGSREVRVNMVV